MKPSNLSPRATTDIESNAVTYSSGTVTYSSSSVSYGASSLETSPQGFTQAIQFRPQNVSSKIAQANNYQVR